MRSGFVPIEAVERFLSGEIVTQGENARLERRRQTRRLQRSCAAASFMGLNRLRADERKDMTDIYNYIYYMNMVRILLYLFVLIHL